jgi:hypothetical protein
MSDETLPDDWYLRIAAASEFRNLQPQIPPLIEKLAAVLADTDPDKRYVADTLEVETRHVQAAFELVGRTIERATSQRAKLQVFVSYKTEDEALARELCKMLDKRGVASFLAASSIEPAADWVGEILQQLRASRLLLLIATPQAIKSDWCKFEVGAALGLEIPIVCALFQVVVNELPELLRRYQTVVVQTTRQRKELIEKLLTLCRA